MTIVVGYIPTPEGLTAVDYAIEASMESSSHLVVVNSGAGGKDSDPSYVPAAQWDALDRRLEDLGLSHELRQPALAQSPADEILQAASSTGAELIVIGLRRRSPVGKLILGSTAQSVLLSADCPVVSVKQHEP